MIKVFLDFLRERSKWRLVTLAVRLFVQVGLTPFAKAAAATPFRYSFSQEQHWTFGPRYRVESVNMLSPSFNPALYES